MPLITPEEVKMPSVCVKKPFLIDYICYTVLFTL